MWPQNMILAESVIREEFGGLVNLIQFLRQICTNHNLESRHCGGETIQTKNGADAKCQGSNRPKSTSSHDQNTIRSDIYAISTNITTLNIFKQLCGG
jgi:hypothetical protein